MSEGAPQVRSDVNVIKEGTVYKLAGYFRKTWEARWFRLRGRQLLYYKSETDTMEPRQKLNLRGAHVFRTAEGKVNARTPWCIEIKVVEPTTKSYFFCVDTEEQLTEWVEAITGASRYVMKECCKLKSHDEQITCTTFSLDGKRMVTGTESGVVKLWDLKLFKLIGTLEAHRAKVTALGFCQKGERIFTASLDKTLKFWDSSSLTLLTTIQGFDSGVTTCVKLPKSPQVITGTEGGEVQMWNTLSLQPEGSLRGHSASITHLKLSVDGTKMVSVSEDGAVICWNLKVHSADAMIQSPNPPVLPSISPDGKQFVLAGSKHCIVVYNWEQKVEVKYQLTHHKDKIHACQFAPGGGKLVSASEDRSLLQWDTEFNGQLLFEVDEQKGALTHCAISPTAQLVLSVCGSEVSLWDFQSMDNLKTLKHSNAVTKAFFIPDCSGFISQLDNGTMIVWTL